MSMPLTTKPSVPSPPAAGYRLLSSKAAGKPVERPEDYVALAGFNRAIWVSAVRPNDEIVDAIPVDIARTAYRPTRLVIGVDAREDEAPGAVAAGCREQAAQLEGGGKTRRAAKHHVALTGPIHAIGVGKIRPDDEIVDAIPVDIAR